jgi:hypothetical protein
MDSNATASESYKLSAIKSPWRLPPEFSRESRPGRQSACATS